MKDTIEWKHSGLVFVLKRVPEAGTGGCECCAFRGSPLCWVAPPCGGVYFKVKRVREDVKCPA